MFLTRGNWKLNDNKLTQAYLKMAAITACVCKLRTINYKLVPHLWAMLRRQCQTVIDTYCPTRYILHFCLNVLTDRHVSCNTDGWCWSFSNMCITINTVYFLNTHTVHETYQAYTLRQITENCGEAWVLFRPMTWQHLHIITTSANMNNDWLTHDKQ